MEELRKEEELLEKSLNVKLEGYWVWLGKVWSGVCLFFWWGRRS